MAYKLSIIAKKFCQLFKKEKKMFLKLILLNCLHSCFMYNSIRIMEVNAIFGGKNIVELSRRTRLKCERPVSRALCNTTMKMKKKKVNIQSNRLYRIASRPYETVWLITFDQQADKSPPYQYL